MDYAPQVSALAKALKSIGTVTIKGCRSDHNDDAYGELLYPVAVADLLVAYLADADGLLVMPCKLSVLRVNRPEPPGDPEVAAIAAIVAAMDALDGETALLGTDVHERVIRWAMARYLGPVSG